MEYSKLNHQILIVLVVCLIILNFSNCTVIRKGKTSPWNVEVDDNLSNTIRTMPPHGDKSTTKPLNLWNKILTTRSENFEETTENPSDPNKFPVIPFEREKLTAKSFDSDRFTFDWNIFTFDWNRFTAKPLDWDKTTAKPFDWNRFTAKPFDWDKSTANPFDWNRFTFDWGRFTYSPDDYNYHYRETDTTSLKIAIFVPITIVVIIIAICRYFVCNGKRNSNTSTPILHPPPRRIIPPPLEIRREQTRSVQTATLLREELFSRTPTVHSTRGNASDPLNRADVTDKPPGYSDVIMGDFGQNNYFPAVKPIIPETPPPQYDEKDVMRY